MLNNEKIILMTKLSLYEQKNEKSEIKSSRYFKSDYMLMKMLGSFISVTVGYILCLVLWIIFSADKMIGSMTTTGKFVGLLVILVIIYVALTVTSVSYTHLRAHET